MTILADNNLTWPEALTLMVLIVSASAGTLIGFWLFLKFYDNK